MEQVLGLNLPSLSKRGVGGEFRRPMLVPQSRDELHRLFLYIDRN